MPHQVPQPAPELPDLRRIVTGHDARGNAIITHDGDLAATESRSTIRGRPLWLLTEVPSLDNNREEDGANRKADHSHGLVRSKGANTRATDLAPGAVTPMHRTDSIDFNILVSGEVVLILEDGTERHLKNPGDTVVQRGTMHAWRNPGKEWCRWVSVLVDAEPARVDGAPLPSAWIE